MNINVEHQPNCRAIAHVRVPGEEVNKNRDEIVSYFARQVRLPGYRPGKTPKSVVAKRYEAEIRSELENQLVNEGLRQAIKNEGLEVLNVLSVKDKLHHDPDRSFSFSAELMLAPKFELPDYKGIPVKLPRIEVTDADIDHDLLHMRERQQTFEDVDRAAANDDVVSLSYSVSLDGRPVEQTVPDVPEHLKKVEEQWFLLDTEEDFLPGFYASMQGITKGAQKKVEVALPDDFGVEALRGRTIVLDVTCSAVKEKRLPELTEEFAKKIGGEEMTVETLRGEVREAVRRRREQARDQSTTNQVLAALHDRIEFDIPQEIINREAQRRTNEMAQRAMQSGMGQEELMKHQEEIVGAATQQARQSVKVNFILEQVAQKEQIEVSDQQLSAALASWAARSGMPVKKFLAEAKKGSLIENLRGDLLLQNTLNFLKDNAAVEETDPETERCEVHGR
ncbi:MAG: trigger factor [Verrucomicrobiaceae bacterium]|nr:trigger factor [Verrucomicrobiaceae bacterium]